ncbi:hypothetical protein COLO4_06803 [Corchorus olitorius]|uniref:Uncharacterized protein n=1 Tax=Corchorus olitorius TaxID=93759 RepID=A0A1R3KLU9_9ROSI|nr:hypothetical protein COLO4_06803 [Corchorus olitorius]
MAMLTSISKVNAISVKKLFGCNELRFVEKLRYYYSAFLEVLTGNVCSGDETIVSFWVSHIRDINLDELGAMLEKPIVVVAGTTMMKSLATKYLSSSSSTKVYVNPVPETEEIRESNLAKAAMS